MEDQFEYLSTRSRSQKANCVNQVCLIQDDYSQAWKLLEPRDILPCSSTTKDLVASGCLREEDDDDALLLVTQAYNPYNATEQPYRLEREVEHAYHLVPKHNYEECTTTTTTTTTIVYNYSIVCTASSSSLQQKQQQILQVLSKDHVNIKACNTDLQHTLQNLEIDMVKALFDSAKNDEKKQWGVLLVGRTRPDKICFDVTTILVVDCNKAPRINVSVSLLKKYKLDANFLITQLLMQKGDKKSKKLALMCRKFKRFLYLRRYPSPSTDPFDVAIASGLLPTDLQNMIMLAKNKRRRIQP